MAPLDAVIDEVFGKQLGMQERQLAADEVAYSFFSSVREAAGEQMDPETSAELNRLLALSQAEKDAILQKTNRVARRVLRPLGYKVLQVQGLDPDTVSPAAARAALQAELSPQQQAAVDAEAERLFKEVYIPELQAAAEDADVEDAETAWQQFGASLMARQPADTQQQNTAAIAVPAALAGAVVALVVSKVFGWLQRRRQQQRRGQQDSSEQLTASEFYEEEGEELLTGSDSAQDATTAYDG